MLNKLRAWWSKDDEELAAEETTMTRPRARLAQEDYEGQKDDLGGGGYAREPQTDCEARLEKPRY